MLNNSSTAPWVLQFALLRKITDGFSVERKVGSGGYGEVYKGKLDNGEEIAVKKLYPQPGLGDKQFMNEFSNLIKVQHENIVRLVGYCYDEQDEYVQHNGKLVLAQREYRMLCFEYLHGGSLDKHLYEEHCGLDWHTRYKIIRGICEGLNYLHGLKESILHLDLKPANILLDKNMVPKIADFGLSRLFGETRTHITKNCIGTKKYMPPEFILECRITKKYDVFSLGVIIIEIMTGREGYSKYYEMSTSEQFIELVHNKWKVRIEATSIHTSTEEDCKQVKRCIEIALNCVEAERHKRPMIGDIIHKLRETETMHHEVSMSFSQEPGSVSSHFKREMVPNGKEFSPRLETMEEKRGQGGEEDEEKAGFSKIGPWGGNAGRAHDIKVSSYRLESVTIWCADIVDALAFSYSDLNGKMHTVGPWGGPGGSPRTIKVGPSEFLMEVSGTTGPYILAAADVVRSLMLVTNAGSYGPFGQGGGTAFRTSVQSNDSIVGFFGRAERFVHAIGVYVKHNLPTLAASRHFEREMDQMVRDEKVYSELETIQGERGKEDDDVLSEIQLSPRPEPDTDYSFDEDERIARALKESLNTESPSRQNVPVENVPSASVPAKEPPPHVFPSSGVRTCAGCKNPIGHGRFLSCMDSVWHPQCFRCFACDKPISEYEFSMHEGQPYHKSCYKELFHAKCDVCNNFIPTNKDGLIEYRAHTFWMQKYCPSHEDDGTPRCCSCERMEPMDIKYITLDDGRKLYLECLNSAIMDTPECQHLYMDIQEFFEGLNMKVEQQVPLLLVERQALNEAMEAEKSGHHLRENRGLCLSEEQVVRTILRRPIIGPANRFIDMITGPYRLARRCEVTAILILYGLPRWQTGCILAHEVMRAYLRLKGYRSLSPEVEEGICQVLSHMWLESEIISGSSGNATSTSVSSSSSSTPTSSKKGAKTEFEKNLRAFIMHQIETDPSVIYGDGFRAGIRAVEHFGLRSTLDHIRMTGSFPY